MQIVSEVSVSLLRLFPIVPILSCMDQKERERIGATIRALREAYGWRVGKFATAVRLSHSHLSNIESGRKAPTADVLRRIADTLGVPLAAVTTQFDVEDVA